MAMLFHHGPFTDPADSYITATYAMLAAESFGLGSCMIGTVRDIVNNAKDLKKELGLPAKNKAGIVLVLGYSANKFQKAIRRQIETKTI